MSWLWTLIIGALIGVIAGAITKKVVQWDGSLILLPV